MAIPPQFHAWYKSNYPTLAFNSDWLEACVEYLQSTDPQCNSTTSILIKAVESQLLSSDLSTSVSLSSPAIDRNRVLLSSLHHASASDQDKVLYRGGRKSSRLFQVEKVDDVGHSASSLLEIVKEKQEWKKLKLKGGVFDGGRDMRLDDEEEEGAGNEIEEEEKRILAGGTGKEPRFPRGSGKFVLSDGANLAVAFELQRINGLGLEEIKLGTKLLVHDVPFINGVMLLTPQNTIVKGHDVEELEQFSEWTFENTLRERLELEPLPKPLEAGNRSPSPPPARRSPSPLPPKPDIKPARQNRILPSPRAGPSNSRSQPKPDPPTSSSNRKPLQAASTDDEYFQEPEEEEDGIDYDALQAQAIAQSRQTRARSQPQPQRALAPPLAKKSTDGKRKGKERALDQDEDLGMGDFEGQEEEDEDEDEEGWNAMNEVEQQQKQQQQGREGKSTLQNERKKTNGSRTRGAVKSEPRSSGGARGTTSTEVEVLELDSDDEGDEGGGTAVHRPTKKSKRAPEAGGGGRRGARKEIQNVTVLELDDSD